MSDGERSFAWNSRNQLTQVKQAGSIIASFAYDALGRRLSKTAGGKTDTYLYDGQNLVQSTADGVVTSVLAGLDIDERFSIGAGADRDYFLTDALGSTVGLADPDGELVENYLYEPYGAEVPRNAGSNSFRFTGREADESGLYYYRERYYSPAMGRFISEDPLRELAGVNGYAYVGGIPTLLTDPEGLAPEKGRGGRGERGQSGSPDGTKNPSKHWTDDPNKPGWGWQKDNQTGKKIHKKKPPYLCRCADDKPEFDPSDDPFEYSPPAPTSNNNGLVWGIILALIAIGAVLGWTTN